MHEASKAVARYQHDAEYARRFIVGDVLDIGAGNDPIIRWAEFFPLVKKLRPWDVQDGDAQKLPGIAAESYNTVFSSHCLEHMVDPFAALRRWWEVLKPGGHAVIIVPDEDLYEQGVWPSVHNPDHKSTFTIWKPIDTSWSPASVNVMDLISSLGQQCLPLRVQLLTRSYRYIHPPDEDQTLGAVGECAIEFVLLKLPVVKGLQRSVPRVDA